MILSTQSSKSMAHVVHGSAPLDYSIWTELRDIASISGEWDTLLAKSRCNRAFSCSKWYLATPCLLPDLKPLVLVAKRNGRIAGIFPFWLDTGPKEAGFPDDYSDHLDIIAEDDDLEVITGLLSAALRGSADFSRLSLTHIKPDSNCVRAAQELGLCDDVDKMFGPPRALAYAVVDLTCGYERFRKIENLDRFRRKAQRDGIEVREFTPADLSPASLPELFLALHAGRFGERTSLRSICKSPEVWIHRLFPALFAEKRMRVFVLLQKGRIAGIDLVMVARSGVYAWNGGFFPEVARYAPGKLLIDKTIQQCCLENLAEYDLGWFGQEHKTYWSPITRYIGELVLNTGPQ